MSISVGLVQEKIARPSVIGGAMPGSASNAGAGALHRGSLRFIDPELERRYQLRGGAESLAGFQITTATAASMWLFAVVVVPTAAPIAVYPVLVACSILGMVNAAALLFSDWAHTLDRQHSIVALLTSINGLAIVWLATVAGLLPGYAISAIMLLFAFGFVSRTGFLYATYRSAVIVAGFIAAALLYRGPGSLLIDAFIFGAAVIGTLVALRMLETSRRRLFYQDIVITQQADALGLAKQRSDALLLDVLPASITTRLLRGERAIADVYPDVTVLFADIVGFTPLTARLPAHEVVGLLDRLYARFDALVAGRGLEKIKTIGDAYMVAGGVPDRLDDHAARVVDLGLAMLDVARDESVDGVDVRLRIGVHSGPVIGGVIGHRKFAFDIWGETVNVASRLETAGIPGRVQVSDATWKLIADRFEGEARGAIELRGHGDMETYTVASRR